MPVIIKRAAKCRTTIICWTWQIVAIESIDNLDITQFNNIFIYMGSIIIMVHHHHHHRLVQKLYLQIYSAFHLAISSRFTIWKRAKNITKGLVRKNDSNGDWKEHGLIHSAPVFWTFVVCDPRDSWARVKWHDHPCNSTEFPFESTSFLPSRNSRGSGMSEMKRRTTRVVENVEEVD